MAKTHHVNRIKPGAELGQKNDFLLNVFNSLPAIIIVVSRDYQIRYVNLAAEEFLDCSLNAARGKELAHFVFPATDLLKLIDNVFEHSAVIKEFSLDISGPRIGTHTVQIQIGPLQHEDSEQPVEAVICLHDLGQANKLSHHIAQREITRSAGLMAAILAHEVKNPLSGIRGAAQLLGEHEGGDQKLTRLICKEVDRIKALLDQMEIFSNDAPLKTNSVNIHEVLQHVIELLKQGGAGKVDFREIYDPSLPLVEGNQELLIQLFLNLLKNAEYATASQAAPQIRLITSYHSGYRVKRKGEAHAIPLPIQIRVEDNGCGIPESIKSSIFEPFITSRPGGKGLGLSIVAKIIADHGGAIELDERTTAGTAFNIMLPAAKSVV